MQITLTLPEQVFARAEHWAQRMGRPVDEVLVQVITSSLTPLGPANETSLVTNWTDEEVLAAANLQLSPDDDRRLSELLHLQQANQLTERDRSELTARMLGYQEGLLRKAQGLREAVWRGLQSPVAP